MIEFIRIMRMTVAISALFLVPFGVCFLSGLFAQTRMAKRLADLLEVIL